jgi:hypothetical protein
MVLRRATSITRGIGRDWKLEIEGLEMAKSEANAIWAQ